MAVDATPAAIARLRPSDAPTDDRSDRRTALADARDEVRALRLEGTTFAADVRELARVVQWLGQRDDSPDTRAVGLEIEYRADRHLRQRREGPEAA